jgi:hypothetical protein
MQNYIPGMKLRVIGMQYCISGLRRSSSGPGLGTLRLSSDSLAVCRIEIPQYSTTGRTGTRLCGRRLFKVFHTVPGVAFVSTQKRRKKVALRRREPCDSRAVAAYFFCHILLLSSYLFRNEPVTWVLAH